MTQTQHILGEREEILTRTISREDAAGMIEKCPQCINTFQGLTSCREQLSTSKLMDRSREISECLHRDFFDECVCSLEQQG